MNHHVLAWELRTSSGTPQQRPCSLAAHGPLCLLAPLQFGKHLFHVKRAGISAPPQSPFPCLGDRGLWTKQNYSTEAPGVFCWSLLRAAAAESLQSCPTLCDGIDGSPRGSPVPGILQARTLERAAISFSSAWKEKWEWSRPVVSDSSRPHGLQPAGLLRSWDFPGKSSGVGCHRLLLLPTWVRNKFLLC